MTLHEVGRLPPIVRQIGVGIVYWLSFLLVLEPGNIMRALHAGGGPSWSQEIIRIACASLLGASSAPLLFALVRRFPVEGRAWWKHALIHAAVCAVVSLVLIAVSCLLAELILTSEHRSFLTAFRAEFISNWLLLSFCLAGFLAVSHALRFFRQIRSYELAAATTSSVTGYVTQLPVKARGQIIIIELDSIDWIEAQGNYLALHVGRASHLIRESLGRLEPKLDPVQFSRIHRSAIVAVNRVRDMTSLGAGDAALRLKDGTELRVSRNFRDHLTSLMRPKPTAER